MSEAAKPPVSGVKLRGADKMARLPVAIEVRSKSERLPKPKWIRAAFSGGPEVARMKRVLRAQKLHTVCEEAACPNIGECFGKGTATFLIMGDICTRRCPFCEVAHGRPLPLDAEEPAHLAETVAALGLKYVVITSVDRDDLRDGGAAHFAACIEAVRGQSLGIRVEILVPDFRGRAEVALKAFEHTPADVFNHNLETVPRLYKRCRPGSDYEHSLDLLEAAAEHQPLTKSGLMLGLGETRDEVLQVMEDLRAHRVDMLTLGQYLQPSPHHLAVERYWTPEEFDMFREAGERMGFAHVASAPMVRSSYHADRQAEELA